MSNEELLSARYQRRFLALLFLVSAFNLADRAVFSVMAPLMRVDLGLTDSQLGLLQGLSFALLYGGIGLPIGRLAERWSRVNIISIATVVWSFATACSGMAGNYVQMLLSRAGVGMGEAGFTAPTSSLVADHFPRQRRASAMSIIMLGVPIGSMMGAILAGVVAQQWGWRAAFFAFAIPGIAVGLAVRFLLKEPPRGLADGKINTAAVIPPLRAVISHLWKTPSLRWMIIGGAICSIGVQGVAQFMALYLVRSFELPIRSASILFGVVSGVSLSVGLLVGGFGADRASGRDPRWWALAPAFALLVTPVLFIAGFNSLSLSLAVVLIGAGCCGAMFHYGPTVGVIQNLTPINMRSSAAACFAMLYALAGTGIGPTFVGFVSDHYAKQMFPGQDYFTQCRPGQLDATWGPSCAAVASSGLIKALSLCVLAYGIAALFYFLAARRLRGDVAASDGRQPELSRAQTSH
jgi:predicted MFS family arabinose efflux permease